MKIKHIIFILVIIAVMAAVISTMTGSGAYADFSEAARRPGKELHITGRLNRAKPVEYDAVNNPGRFSFYMIDEKGNERKVVCEHPKPQDFEKSDKVVVIGTMNGKEFKASSLLLKCPSKYENRKPISFGEKQFN